MRPGDIIIEIKRQTRPDGYPDSEESLGRFWVTSEFIKDNEKKLLMEVIGNRVLDLITRSRQTWSINETDLG